MTDPKVTEAAAPILAKPAATAQPSAAEAALAALYPNGSPGGASPGAGAEGGAAAPVGSDPAASTTPPAEGEKPADPPAGEPAAFDPTKVVMPEGVEVDQAGMELVAPIFTELGLKQDQAQKVIDAYIKLEQGKLEQNIAQQAEWAQEIKTDKEFGGEKFDLNAQKANQLLERFGDEQLFEYLASSGAGNNPAVFRLMSRIAAAIGEDSPVVTTTAAAPAKQDVLSILYPEKKG